MGWYYNFVDSLSSMGQSGSFVLFFELMDTKGASSLVGSAGLGRTNHSLTVHTLDSFLSQKGSIDVLQR